MEVVIKDIAESNLKDIPASCRGCVYWEFPREFEAAQEKMEEKKAEFERKKRDWFVQTLREFGACGKIVYSGNVPIGYAQYGPSTRLPQSGEYKSKPVGRAEDGVVFISCLYISDKAIRGKGVGEKLLDAIVADLKKRGFKAVETFARKGDSNNPSGPLEFYLKKGFHVKDETNPEFPLMRLDL